LNVAITGAAGQIGYALAFRVASGQMLGPDQPVNLHLLEITAAMQALQGVVMELATAHSPRSTRWSPLTMRGPPSVIATSHCWSARARVDRHGAQGSAAARQRADLFGAGESSQRIAQRNVKVLVVGNPANTNALIAESARCEGPESAQFHRDDPS